MKNLFISAVLAAALVAPATYAMSEVERGARRMNLPHHYYMHNSHMHHKKMHHHKGMKHHRHKHPTHMKHRHMKKGQMHMQKSPHKMQKGEGTEGKMEQRTKAQIQQQTELTNH